jgi:hypothetical protein
LLAEDLSEVELIVRVVAVGVAVVRDSRQCMAEKIVEDRIKSSVIIRWCAERL